MDKRLGTTALSDPVNFFYSVINLNDSQEFLYQHREI